MKNLVLIILLIGTGFAKANQIRSYMELRFDNLERQNSEYTCGVAVLSTLLTSYFSDTLKEEEILESFLGQCISQRKNINFLDMSIFLKKLKYHARGYRVNLEGLQVLLIKYSPIIAHVSLDNSGNGHFVLVLALIGKEQVVIKDPAFGNMIWGIDEFTKRFTGNVLVVETNNNAHAKKVSLLKKEIEQNIQYLKWMYRNENFFK